MFVNARKKKSKAQRVLTTIKRSNKVVEALELPKIANINPRSIYNKIDEFSTYIEEEEIYIVFLSESHERSYPTRNGDQQTLKEIIEIQDFQVISNPSQRKDKGGRPALVINTSKYHVQNLTQSDIIIPWGVEIVWAVITPIKLTSESTIRKIVVGSLYCKPNSKKKTALLNHIAEVHQMLSTRYKKGLHWILAGDFNDLKVQRILDISQSFKQVVTEPTCINQPAILDKIVTSLHCFYQTPEIQLPLDNDPERNGSPSDHRIVVMKPITVVNNKH